MASELDLLIQLKTQLVNFLDELIESFPTESDFVIFRIFVKDQIPIADIMKYIVENLCPLQDQVRAEDEKFFLNHNLLFEKFDEKKTSKVNHFRKLWLSSNVDSEDRKVLWKWFATFIYLGNKYLELKKK